LNSSQLKIEVGNTSNIKKSEANFSITNQILSKLKKPSFIAIVLSVLAIFLLFFLQNNLEFRKADIIQRPVINSEGTEFETGYVIEIIDEGENIIGEISYPFQILKVELSSGEVIEVYNDIQPGGGDFQSLAEGEQIVVAVNETEGQASYYISDRYRFPAVILVFLMFFALTVFFTGFRGVTAILGLFFTVYVLASYVVPSIVFGDDPLLVSLVGVLIIASVSIFLAHGVNKRILVSLAGIIITIAIASIVSLLFVNMASLFGVGSEEAILLNISESVNINLRGLLLGGIIFGVLGVLDDVTTAQSAAVEELKKANPELSQSELYSRGISIGKEHILSLVNTLVLAYIGSAFPLLLLFSLSNGVPVWVTLNSEFIIEEVIRTLVGSSALIFAVPITTLIASYVFSRAKIENDQIDTKNKG